MAEQKNINGSRIFAFSVRDFVVLFTLLAALFGNNLITGTPRGAKNEISDQLDSFKEDVMDELQSHKDEMATNAAGIKDLERKYDELRARMDTMYKMLINIDGYYQSPADDGR